MSPDLRAIVPVDSELCVFVGHSSGDVASTFKSNEMSGYLVHTYSKRNLGAVGILDIRDVYVERRDLQARRNLVNLVITPAGRSGIIGPTIPLRASS